MIHRLAPAIAATALLVGCNPAPVAPAFPAVDAVEVTPAQVTDAATPFTIRVAVRSGTLDRTGVQSPLFPVPGTLKVLDEARAEWRPAGTGAALPTAALSLPVNLLGIQGSSPQTPAKFVFLRFEPVAGGGLAYKGFTLDAPSPAAPTP